MANHLGDSLSGAGLSAAASNREEPLQAERLSAPADPRDAAALAEIDARASASAWTARQFQEEIEKMWSRVWTWRSGDRLAAFGVYWRVDGEAQLANLAVDPLYQRRGWGGRILAELLRQAAREGAGRMFLEVREGNGAARRLYAAAGFRETGRRAAFYDGREDAILMEKNLEVL